MIKKRVLVYPCGTEIGLEILRSCEYSTRFQLIGGSCSNDHGRFAYKEHIDNMPFIKDTSDDSFIDELNGILSENGIDYIYPAMDGVISRLAQVRESLRSVLITPSISTAMNCRSKKKTYEILKDIVPVPKTYKNRYEVDNYPIFMKPDVGQGSSGAVKINSEKELEFYYNNNAILLEYLPGREYTVDCFTNSRGELIYASGRVRNRIRNGISVSTEKINDPRFFEYGRRINSHMPQFGGWFFQIKENADGDYILLEVAARIAGTSGYSRCMGINLPLLTLYQFDGENIDSVIENNYHLEMDRALHNKYKINLTFDTVYIDFDDTLIVNDELNLQVIELIFKCFNDGKKVYLVTKHKGSLDELLDRYRIGGIFDGIIKLEMSQPKYEFISERNSIFIDDSFGERSAVAQWKGIPVFDTHMIECLL